LCAPFLSVEKERVFVKQHTLNSTRWFIDLDSPEGRERAKMRAQVQEILEADSTPERSRLLCWQLLASAHSSANRAILTDKDLPVDFISAIKDDLKSDSEWVLKMLKARVLSLSEFRAARELWDWHCRFDKDESIKNIASECEHHLSAGTTSTGLSCLFQLRII